MPQQPLSHRLMSSGIIRRGVRVAGNHSTHAAQRQAIAPTDRPPAHDAGDQMERWWQWRARQPRMAPGTIDDLDREIALKLHAAVSAKASKKREGLAIRAHEHVLSVVDALAG